MARKTVHIKDLTDAQRKLLDTRIPETSLSVQALRVIANQSKWEFVAELMTLCYSELNKKFGDYPSVYWGGHAAEIETLLRSVDLSVETRLRGWSRPADSKPTAFMDSAFLRWVNWLRDGDVLRVQYGQSGITILDASGKNELYYWDSPCGDGDQVSPHVYFLCDIVQPVLEGTRSLTLSTGRIYGTNDQFVGTIEEIYGDELDHKSYHVIFKVERFKIRKIYPKWMSKPREG